MAKLLNKKVKHFGKFGVGTVIEQDDTSITVEFPAKTCKFQYPAAFEKFLTAEDKDVADAISVELKAAKDAEEVAKAAEAAKKAAEEQAKLEALKAQASSSGKKVSTWKDLYIRRCFGRNGHVAWIYRRFVWNGAGRADRAGYRIYLE